MIYNAFRKLLAKYCQALPQEDSSLIYEISSLQYEKSQKSNPAVAQHYEKILQNTLNELERYVNPTQSPHDRHRRSPISEMTKLLLKSLYEFEKAPMNDEMRAFFKGFEQERSRFMEFMRTQQEIPGHEFQELFNQIKSPGAILVAMDQYETAIKSLLTTGEFGEVGKIALLRVDIKLKKGSFPAAEPTLNSHNKASKPLSMAEQDEYCK
ncbi:hypothetical protein [Endozoicomonas sp. SCSIO W0465]|uniref:hypothetical protein n=1 Tax=Endozoicomonas sp. SCSIO W0465 TaxID=2918516 RepID=UPI0020753F58|nr:hypothetical protein [Endozoicomonas sp. SCSIO W0465]USE34385.1 hypothetical protein MJO57_19815 [Endozoicomonas sp. SCSIO W0465]